MTSSENGMLGILAGAIEVTSLQPILYWKNAAQQHLPFTLDPRKLYRGLLTSVANMAILTGLQFPLTGMCTKLITGGKEREMNSAETISAALMGGALSGLACGPMELIMIQQQRFGGSIIHSPIRIISNFGLFSLSRGTFMSCGREALYTGGVLGMCPVFTNKLENDYNVEGNIAKMGASIAAGTIAATFSHPMDTIKSCVQGDLEYTKYKSQIQTAQTLYAEGGIGRFFTGWAYRTGRMILAVAIMNECKIRLSPIMFPHHFRD
eukprot:CAMPEP_0197294322 /NCGR_PEP_ID=MMETSP0890-20130614/32041_1 /TAXON_ID=44058 ORGANISM="Aureoumbra lagunensis, Strain CCMP1510" /NCGR_SAMPLE_ID=MMETSP0890 /ASSEMBLY_ACC=CAM_ASM_000533 /LENGTH=264 /DNA_ID=CAMNT_0042769673 /DNA_START=103 /DNA_END=897 /DNA_ORIENTATION=+